MKERRDDQPVANEGVMPDGKKPVQRVNIPLRLTAINSM
jgi:hypothetical protein